MSKRTLALIIVLVIITSILVALAVTPEKKPSAPLTVVPTPTPVAQTVLSLSPNPLLLSSQSASFNVRVDATGNNNLTAVQLELSYDPKTITSIDIKPGSFFPNGVELLKSIDTKNGKVSYAVGIPPIENPVGGQGVVATITFRTNLAAGQQTQISFLPKTLVTASGVAASVLKSTSNLIILFQNPPPQATTSPKLP